MFCLHFKEMLLISKVSQITMPCGQVSFSIVFSTVQSLVFLCRMLRMLVGRDSIALRAEVGMCLQGKKKKKDPTTHLSHSQNQLILFSIGLHSGRRANS